MDEVKERWEQQQVKLTQNADVKHDIKTEFITTTPTAATLTTAPLTYPRYLPFFPTITAYLDHLAHDFTLELRPALTSDDTYHYSVPTPSE